MDLNVSRVVLRASCSALALVICSAPAWANCDPKPTQSGTPTICDGVEAKGLVVNRPQSVVTVKAGATVSGPGAGIRVELFDNMPGFQFGAESSSITVEAGATISGQVGIDAIPPLNQLRLEVNLSNAGTIMGSSGIALRGSGNANSRFSSIYNAPTGAIGAIRGQVGNFRNEGLIDGGTLTAYEDANQYLTYFGQGTVENSGTIRSTSGDATLNLFRTFNPNEHVNNSGIIENLGSGVAINGAGTYLNLINDSTGVIRADQVAVTAATIYLTNLGTVGANGTALQADNMINLINEGAIIGDVRVDPSVFGFGSTIDNRGGTIDGDVILGSGDDMLVADLAAANPYGVITGALDAGAGLDIVRYVASADITLTQAPTLPDSFERIDLRVEDGATLTLAEAVQFTTGISVSGSGEGQLINKGTIEAVGPALISRDFSSSNLQIVNEGTIKSMLAAPTDWAVSIGWDVDFHNVGSITAAGGNGLLVSYAGSWTNDGSIVADGMAVRSERNFVNNGLIRSTAGVGLAFYGQSYTFSENHGTIEGVSAGVVIDGGGLSNGGTISATHGPAVQFTGGGTLVNQAAGVISSGSSPAVTAFASARVVNAGAINGDVFLALLGSNFQTNNVFVAAPGGILNGNLNLGSGGDLFVTSLVNDGPGQYAGVTGTVTGSGSQTIRYLIDRAMSASLSVGGIFSAVGYEMIDGAKLTLDAAQAHTSGIHFAGTGSVDMNVDISVNGTTPVLDLRAPSYLTPSPNWLPAANALTIVSHGDITHNYSSNFTPGATVSMMGGSTFQNDGTITSRNLQPYMSLATVMASGTVINNGNILLDGATGVMGSFFGSEPPQLDVINNGTILQIGNNGSSTAIANATSLVNSGLIDVGYIAVYLTEPGYYQQSFLRNSGTIRSRNEVAISSSMASVINEVSGRIESAPARPAIVLRGGSTLDNAGMIIGDVRLLSSSSFGTAYIGSGGSVTGNLTFGEGDDLLILRGDASGVSGMIDGGDGTDTLVRLFTASQTIDVTSPSALPLNFEGHGYGASGADTVLTITGAAQGVSSPLTFLGDGTVINRVNVNTSGDLNAKNAVQLGFRSDIYTIPTDLSFVNEATLADGITGEARSFVNKGQIGSPIRGGVFLGTADSTTFNFLNQGAIAGGTNLFDEDVGHLLETATIKNDGQMNGALYVSLFAKDFRFENTGVMSGAPQSVYAPGAPVVRVGMPFSYSQDDLNADRAVFMNSGTMVDGFLVQAAADTLSFVNSGSIGAPNGLAVSVSGELHGTLVDDAMTYLDQASASFENSGQISGRVVVMTNAKSVSASNSGSITVGAGANQLPHVSDAAFRLDGQAIGDTVVTFQNSGSIKQENAGYRAMELIGKSASKVSLLVTNKGSITADGGAVFLHDPVNNDPSIPTYLAVATALNIAADRTIPASSIEISNAAGATLSATGVAVKGDGSNDSVPSGLENAGSVALFASAATVRIVNDGVIAGRAGGTLPSDLALFGVGPVTETFLAGAIQTEDSVDTLINNASGVIFGSISLGAHNDRLENAGRIEGDVYLGTGDDIVVIKTGGVFAGIVRGGDGSDRIELATSSTYAAPTDLDASRFVGMERLTNTTGVNAFTGALTADIDVNGGYLFGRAGSALFGNVAVAAGARFGSAGTVTGNIVVASGGELAPGASPGTMTVNGTVNLNSGSTTIFEVAPSGPSDRLIVNGALVIAPGAMLNLTGDRPLVPGVSYDLFSATTLTGSFSAITQSGAIQGLVRSTANGAALIATVIAPVDSGTQARGAIDYINGLIGSGEANPALVAAMPSLLDVDGRASAQAFSRLSAEAYASASQLGIEHGLVVARAGRSGLGTAPQQDVSGLFSFAQGVGAWRTLKADSALGTARATSSISGVFGGVGFAGNGSSIGGFVGYLDGRQTMSSLDARTELGGVTVGLSGHLVSGEFSASALVAYDWGEAETRRVLAGAAATSQYRLRTTSLDLSAGYNIAIGGSWAVRPNAGFTHVSAQRGSAIETGSAVFGLAVDRARFKASFIDGGIALRATGRRAIQPWVDLGVRRQLNGERAVVNAAFLGETAKFTSLGASRKPTQIVTATGLTAKATDQLTVFGSYIGEFGGGSGHNLNAGLRYAF